MTKDSSASSPSGIDHTCAISSWIALTSGRVSGAGCALDPHIPTGIAAAASLAGAVLRREAAADAEACPAALGQLADLHRRQLELAIFMEVQGPTIDPGIERGITRGAGLKGIWDGNVSPAYSPLFDADTMIDRLGNMSELAVEKYGIPRIFGAHIPALAAMKLISSGHKMRLLDQKVGKALARCYMAAGCGTEPVPIRG